MGLKERITKLKRTLQVTALNEADMDSWAELWASADDREEINNDDRKAATAFISACRERGKEPSWIELCLIASEEVVEEEP